MALQHTHFLAKSFSTCKFWMPRERFVVVGVEVGEECIEQRYLITMFPHQYIFSATVFVAVVAFSSPCRAFQQVVRHLTTSIRTRKIASHPPISSDESISSCCSEPRTLNSDIASQFTIQVCTSTSCTKKLNEAGLDQYNVLGEIYALAQAANVEKCMIIEDGGCQGGKNCKMGAYILSRETFYLSRIIY